MFSSMKHPMKPQKSFGNGPHIDVIGAVDSGYRTVWAERHYLLRLALVPLAIKIICLGLVVALGWESNFIRHSLVMLPASLAEGWMLAHLVRLILLNQRWPFRPTGDTATDSLNLDHRARGIMGGAVLYVLIKQVQAGFLSVMASLQAAAVTTTIPSTDPAISAAAAAPSPVIAIAALAALVLTLWAFRLMFLYIPVAAGTSMAPILRVKGSFILSLRVIGVWLVSVVPCLLLMIFFMSSILPPSVEAGVPAPLNMAQQSALVVFQAIGDSLMMLISTAALAFALRSVLYPQSPLEGRGANR
jgi:hypothetical protein